MARVLVLHSSFDGQTRRIAQRVAAALASAGHAVRVLDAADNDAAEAIRDHDAVVVGGAIRYGRFRRSLERFLRAQAAALQAGPNALFAVSLSAGGPGARPERARQDLDAVCRRTGWDPGEVACFAGALQYSRYNFLLRLMMRFIVGQAGGDTDTRRDYEYTNWDAVDRFAAGFAARLGDLAAAGAPRSTRYRASIGEPSASASGG